MSANNLPAPPAPAVLIDPQAAERNALLLLAREIAFELDTLDVILKRKGLTEAQYEKIAANPLFQRYLSAETETWHSSLNTENRLRIQSAYMAEQAMPHIFTRVTDPRENLPACVEGMKVMLRTAGIGDRAVGVGTGEKFVISINIGEGKEVLHEVKTIEATAVPSIEGDTNVVEPKASNPE